MIRWRLQVAEAMALLLAARLLVGSMRFGRWRGLLGQEASGPQDGTAGDNDRLLAQVVERAALRLPGESRCLPRAMALHWMLVRRRRPSQLVIAVLAGAARGGLDDLHAWVECGADILIGRLEGPYRPLIRFG